MTVPDDTLVTELHVNVMGKIFWATLAAALVGKIVSTKIRGSRSQIDAVTNALISSRAFQDELSRPGATVDSVIEKLHIKQMSARDFRSKFGIDWPL